ncbi:kinase [Croceicoccus ponticola]|uniref:Kinase n=2 Tax=Croceicoccus ponticola TaxID=2217664 RepID=A0A437GUH7_9SPHN|nr:kinase [Croceicoccus ponticola]
MKFALGDNLFADAIENVWRANERAIAVGLSGAQGSGKSTTAVRIATALHERGLRVTICAIDDFYLSRTERLELAEKFHPLLATRGVPGTHDIALLESTLARVLSATDSDAVEIPQFDKAADDRLPYPEWRISRGASDVVLIEGWCVGARPQDLKSLVEPVNVLERDEDRDGAWRLYVNEQLANDYSRIFSTLDLQLMLRAPSFDCVRAWRAEQEAGLSRSSPNAQPPMDDATLNRFIAHYERISRWMLEDEPADLIADLDTMRAPHAWRVRNV